MLVIFALSLLPRVGAGTEGQRQGAWHGAADDRRRVTPQVSLGLRLCISSRVQNVYFVVLRLVACSFCVLSQQRLFAISCTGPVFVCVCLSVCACVSSCMCVHCFRPSFLCVLFDLNCLHSPLFTYLRNI